MNSLLYATLWNPVPRTRPTWPGHQQTFNGLVQTMLNMAPTVGVHYPIDPSELNTGWCGKHRFLVPRDRPEQRRRGELCGPMVQRGGLPPAAQSLLHRYSVFVAGSGLLRPGEGEGAAGQHAAHADGRSRERGLRRFVLRAVCRSGCGVCGIKIVGAGSGLQIGQSVMVEGTILTDPATGERHISATQIR